MKVVVIVRTRDSRDFLPDFVNQYTRAGVTRVLIADGGSVDGTWEMARSYEESTYGLVQVRNFSEQARVNGLSPNPQWKHLNALIEWAVKEENADWIIFDDVDCIPNYRLRDSLLNFISLAEQEGKTSIFVHRYHVFLKDNYFPKMNEPGPSLYAWATSLNLHALPTPPEDAPKLTNFPDEEQRFIVHEPFVLLHNSWPNEESVSRKRAYYKQVRGLKEYPHPIESFGPMARLPDFACADEPSPIIEDDDGEVC